MERAGSGGGGPPQPPPGDELGRPLPYDVPGVEPVPEAALPPLESLTEARRLVGQGRPFSGHEVLEARWKVCPVEERDLWHLLAQLCVGLTHGLRGNEVGAQPLMDRGATRLTAYL